MLTREKLKDWLNATGVTRQELADALGIAKGSVYNWLSGTAPIPFAKQKLILRIMEEREQSSTPAVPGSDEVTAIALMMTKEQRAYLAAAARKCGQTLEEFILAAAIERAERAIGKFNTSQSAS